MIGYIELGFKSILDERQSLLKIIFDKKVG